MTSVAPRSQTNLPADTTSFIDRRHEVAEAKRQLRRRPLLTVTGPAGVGKTRLALRVAAQVAPAFPDGVWLVELAALAEGKLLAQTMLHVMGIPDWPNRSPVEVLPAHLRDKKLLLVLDNCEHLLDACASLVDELLTAAPGLRILTTSRQVLSVRGEHVLDMAPLTVPHADRLEIADVTRYDAVRLFAERAVAARPGFGLDTDNLLAVVRLCQRLAGLPLAIELAAQRVRMLSPAEILDRLVDYVEVPAAGSRTRPRTLRATIDWSFDLCSQREQILWARTSVFAGGFELDAVEAVGSGEGIARKDVPGLVTELVDKSILTRRNHRAPTRYGMLDAIHEYGRLRLVGSGQKSLLKARHRDYYKRLAKQAESQWLGPGQQEWFVRLQREHANLRAALDFCASEPGEARIGLEMASALWPYWVFSGSLTEGRHWLEQAVERQPEPSQARAKALWVSGWLAVLRGEVSAGTLLVAQSQTLAQRLGDEATMAHAMRTAGSAAFLQGDIPGAVAFLEDALARHRAVGDPAGVWCTLYLLTMVCTYHKQGDRAVAFGEECLALAAVRGADLSRTSALWAIGLARWLHGEHAEATKPIRESLRLKQPLHDRRGIANCVEVLAWAAAKSGRNDRAARLLGAGHTIWRSIGTSPSRLRHLAGAHERYEQDARRSLGDAAFTTAFNEGTQFTLDQAIAYALGDPA
jgi:predicted ATPase